MSEFAYMGVQYSVDAFNFLIGYPGMWDTVFTVIQNYNSHSQVIPIRSYIFIVLPLEELGA